MSQQKDSDANSNWRSDAWPARGESIVGIVRRPPRSTRAQLPKRFYRLPLFALLIVDHYTDSPVGAHLVFRLLEPVWQGKHFGFVTTTSAVSNDDARRIMRTKWAIPCELGHLGWSADAATKSFVWTEREIEIDALVQRRRFPFLKTIKMLQRQSSGTSCVTSLRVRATLQLAHLVVRIPAEDPLSYLSGVRRGFVLSDAKFAFGKPLDESTKQKGTGAIADRLIPKPAGEPGLLGMQRRIEVDPPS